MCDLCFPKQRGFKRVKEIVRENDVIISYVLGYIFSDQITGRHTSLLWTLFGLTAWLVSTLVCFLVLRFLFKEQKEQV